jgi:alpha-1,2-mannosyltransferase
MRNLIIFAAFLALNLIASNVNHIDDTDETYGYYEPLHYLLYQRGLQTWEYAPDFAIRSYSFIFPIYLYCLGILKINPTLSKVTVFQLIRVLLGVFTAYSQTKFVKSISKSFDSTLGMMTALFLALSPGIFYTSTSLLPSAVAMNLVMLSTAACLSSHFSASIFWGCLAVLWTGWPFVALLFVPLGVYMVVSAVSTSVQKTVWLLATGVVILGVTFVPTLLLDHHYYQKW